MGRINDEDIIEIIANVLKLEADRLTIDSSSENVKEWDSLGHLGILLDLDKFFGGKIGGIKEMATANSVSKILKLLKDNSLL